MLLELEHSRDVAVYVRGLTLTASVEASTVNSGWVGGLGFNWTVSSGLTPIVASVSDGLVGGLALHGSDERDDRWLSSTQTQPGYRYCTLMLGSWIIGLNPRSYQNYTYASRQAGPLQPLVYLPNDDLYIGLDGKVTKEDEWSLSLDPRAPNTRSIGSVCLGPSERNSRYLILQTGI